LVDGYLLIDRRFFRRRRRRRVEGRFDEALLGAQDRLGNNAHRVLDRLAAATATCRLLSTRRHVVVLEKSIHVAQFDGWA